MEYPRHIQWIIDNRTEDLTKALSQDNSYKTIDKPFGIFLDADPTDKKKLTHWLVDTYVNGGFRWEDIQSGSNSKVFDTLSLYVKHKSKLDSTNHIGQYDSLGSVYKDIAPFIKLDKSSRSAKRDEQALAYEESEILVKSNALTVVIPKTEYASKWWGKGTQWCTAGDNNNMFERYYKDGPLIIIIVNGVKTQLYVDLVDKDNEVQFMDEHDSQVGINFVEDNWELLSPIMRWAVKQKGEALQYVPKQLKTPELCLEAVRQNGRALRYVPEAFITAELCLDAVRQNGWALRLVPEHLITPKLGLEAIKNNGYSLCYMPEALRIKELCLEAVRENGMALRYVPTPLRTAELCLVAIRQDGLALGNVPQCLQINDIYLEAVKSNGMALAYVPTNLITSELCLESVKQNGHALKYIPESLRTLEVYLEAVMQNGISLGYVPEPLRTAELYLEAVKQNGKALIYVPEHLKTAELYLEAVRQDGKALEFICQSLITPELCLEAVKQDGMALRNVPKSLMTEELCITAVNQNDKSLYYVPEQYKKQISYLFKISWNFNFIEELKQELKQKPNNNVFIF